jgi:hypothetical protein
LLKLVTLVEYSQNFSVAIGKPISERFRHAREAAPEFALRLYSNLSLGNETMNPRHRIRRYW